MEINALDVFNATGIILLILLGIIALIIGCAFLVPEIIFHIKGKYRNFVTRNSEAIKKINQINEEFKFEEIEKVCLSNSYDNADYYNTISCEDYLIYELVDRQEYVNAQIRKTEYNKSLYEKYVNRINSECRYGCFGDALLSKNKDKVLKLEKEIIKEILKKPLIEFSIKVKLYLTNINGSYKEHKSCIFTSEYIKEIEYKMNKKRGNYYMSEDIWNSICRVERGKVSNKLRFQIFERDHRTCKMCGRTGNLEIDHIIPIAKGGKSTVDNLQTLCHDCNQRKGKDIV